MRHRKQKGKLSRDPAHRKALFMNLCREVIDHERIQTTEAKAKAVKPELERLITLAKKGDGHSRRLAMARLGQDKFVVYKLFEEIAPRYAERGWMVPAYTLPPNADHVKIMRALVKLTLGHSLVTTLADDIVSACETLAKKGALHEIDRQRVKTGTGY